MGFFLFLVGMALLVVAVGIFGDLATNDGDGIVNIIRALRGK